MNRLSAVGGLSGLLQFVVHLIEEVLSSLRVTLQIPFVGTLGLDNPFPGLLAQPLCCRQIRMPSFGDILLGPLSNRHATNDKSTTNNSSYNASFDHGFDYKIGEALAQYLGVASRLLNPVPE